MMERRRAFGAIAALAGIVIALLGAHQLSMALFFIGLVSAILGFWLIGRRANESRHWSASFESPDLAAQVAPPRATAYRDWTWFDELDIRDSGSRSGALLMMTVLVGPIAATGLYWVLAAFMSRSPVATAVAVAVVSAVSVYMLRRGSPANEDKTNA